MENNKKKGEKKYYFNKKVYIIDKLMCHKCGCLCATKPREKEFIDSEFIHGRVSKLLLEVVINLGLNFLQKL